MHPLFNGYDTVIFDCDGVILDSNNLKIDAMRNALRMAQVSELEIDNCCNYFKANFGKSRFHHVSYFVEHFILNTDEALYERILSFYSKQCEKLYMEAQLTPNFIAAITDCPAKLYVASGSAQDELREVFVKRKLAQYFTLILGSPTAKADNVATILKESSGAVLMIGDALSDFHAAKENNIDFLGYLPFSNVKEELEGLSKSEGFNILRSW
ncbi:HAD family hydrolase [Vibrio parahaemolyticus]|uniref:HAD family hydrolase n=1 Tax=Vibrio parahaemolyticus TaxID=670 RepID=UPI0011406AB7|nr:HAD hydrolase-like protein [Vibrio parahaemolyticus]EJB8583626.1 HAD family hydrolase [Vibrio parahaemolyticus]EJG0712525.1 HAD family hydrolase [Vibrio parahaemolyticus]EJL3948717.1 HAD family hydrolase [Vibrio parahaemolyticus]MDF4558393.1 HAD hydrolase-like protein [Vibrio parahaemolyticus]MDF5017848.1 HAD hydrolase-like protein [Vibrio parahaemolyticus]